MDTVVQDLRLAARRLAKERGFVGATIATLALCLAANAAIFAVVNAVILRQLPYPEPDRLVTVFNMYPGAGSNRSANSVPDYFDRLRETNVFRELALYRSATVTVGGQGQGEAERIFGMTVTPSFFRTLGVQPVRGRLFSESDGEVGQERRVILSKRRFGGSFLLRRSIESQLYGVEPTDPAVVIAVAGLLLFVATVAGALPARRAMLTNPNVTLADQ